MPTSRNSSKGVTSNLRRGLVVAVLVATGLIANVVVDKDLTFREVVQIVVNAARAAGVSIP